MLKETGAFPQVKKECHRLGQEEEILGSQWDPEPCTLENPQIWQDLSAGLREDGHFYHRGSTSQAGAMGITRGAWCGPWHGRSRVSESEGSDTRNGLPGCSSSG